MERESFESPQIGELLNRSFVSIKVDREERPDVDRVYMTFVQVCILLFFVRALSSFGLKYTHTFVGDGVKVLRRIVRGGTYMYVGT